MNDKYHKKYLKYKIFEISNFSLGDYFEMSDSFPKSICHGRQIGGIVKIPEIFNSF